ncbi:MAG: type II secretion system F family protein [Pseudomonadota bacterium]
MTQFLYKARTPHGELLSGQVEASGPAAVAAFLGNNSLIPIEIREAPPPSTLQLWWQRLRLRRVARKDIIMFARQLYSLLHAGVPLLSAIDSLRQTYGSDNRLGLILNEVRGDLDAGRSLSAALARHPEAFSELFVSLVEVGENTGNLDATLLALAGYLERDEDTASRVRRALRYPSFVLLALAVALAILNYFVIPQFARLFKNAHVELPVFTRVLIAVSDFSVHYWWVVLLAGAGLWFGARAALKTEHGRLRWDRHKLRAPVFGSIILKSAMARFARTLQLTGRAGVPILRGIELIAKATDNRFIAERLQGMKIGVERGESLTRTAQATHLFPPLVLQMIAVGEESGSIDELMGEVADFYERETGYEIDALSARIEPIMLVIMGVLVLALALGVFLPMWDMARVVH